MLFVLIGFYAFSQTTVTVLGGVYDEDTEEPIEQNPVWIVTDSIDGFFYADTQNTDADGAYEFNFTIPDDVEGALFITTPGCDGTAETAVIYFSEDSNYHEVDFYICGEQSWDSCMAMFYYYPQPNNWFTLEFMDASMGNPTNWSWEFGDGNTSSEQNPVHTYSEFGEYLVTLTIWDDSSDCESTVSMPVHVGDTIWFPDTCQALFYGYPSQNDWQTMQFIDLSFGNPNRLGLGIWRWQYQLRAKSGTYLR